MENPGMTTWVDLEDASMVKFVLLLLLFLGVGVAANIKGTRKQNGIVKLLTTSYSEGPISYG